MSENTSKLKNAPIGVFDSGVGGLTVVREIMRQAPQERIVYFGDTARVPYGSKSKETILRFSRQNINFLKSMGVKAIVIACNTASALALEELEGETDLPLIGVLKPGAKIAAGQTKNKKVGVIATESTIGSSVYTKVIRSHDPDIDVLGKACPLLCPLVEEGWIKDPVTVEVAGRYLEPLLESGIDTLIMGCTHYPLLRSTLRGIVGDQVCLVNPAYETAIELKALLKELGIANDGEWKGNANESSGTVHEKSDACKDYMQMHRFYVSDAAGKFRKFADSILPYSVKSANLVAIEEY